LLAFANPTASEIRLETTPPRVIPNDLVLKSKIDARLTQQGLSPHIEIYAAQIAAGKLTFYFYLKDHDYGNDHVVYDREFSSFRGPNASASGGYREVSAFRGPDGFALWVKLFMAISEVSGRSLASIEGRTGPDPECSIFVQMHEGIFEQSGRLCEPLIAQAQTPVTIIQGTAKIASAVNVPIPEKLSIQQVSIVTQYFFKSKGVTPIVLDQTSRNVRIKGYGLRNVVIVGENRWEEVTFSIFDTSGPSNKTLDLVVVSDGFYTSALGGPPPTTSYTNSLEPQYFKQLDEFSRSFGEYLREKLSRKQ